MGLRTTSTAWVSSFRLSHFPGRVKTAWVSSFRLSHFPGRVTPTDALLRNPNPHDVSTRPSHLLLRTDIPNEHSPISEGPAEVA
jgi:hypothetical protein